MKQRRLSIIFNNPKGFTLIEIIVVLVLLSIFLAGASANYLSLLDEANNAAAMRAVAEGKARLHQQYAFMLLNNDPHAHKLDAIVAGVSTDAGDYQLTFTVSTNHKEVEVEAMGILNGAVGRASGKWRILKGDS